MNQNQHVTIDEEYPENWKLVPEETKIRIDSTSKKSDTLFLYGSAVTGQLLMIVCGSSIVWNSPVLVKLSSNNTNINPLGSPITPIEVSMLAGMPVLPNLIATLLLPRLADYFGRKKYLQIMGSLTLVGGLVLSFSNSLWYFVIARCFFVAFIHAATIVIAIYITDISEDHNRAKFGCFSGAFIQIGFFICFLVGPLFTIRDFTLIITAPAAIFLGLSFFIPESPLYLLAQKKEQECKRVLMKLRNNKTQKELEVDFQIIKEASGLKAKQVKSNMCTLFKTRENRIALMLALLPLLAQFLSGVAVIMSYLAPLFNSAGTSLSGDTVGIVVAITKIICFMLTSFIVEKFGRKQMLFTSAMGTGVPLFALGIFFYLKHIKSPFVDQIQWLPLVAILSNVIFFSIGLGPIPTAVMNEFFPSELRTSASAFLHTVITIINFFLTASYPIIATTLGTHWCIFFFSVSCFVTGILMYFFLPDTNGKSIGEIQEMLKNY